MTMPTKPHPHTASTAYHLEYVACVLVPAGRGRGACLGEECVHGAACDVLVYAEGSGPTQHLIGRHPQTPPVHWIGVTTR